MRYTRFAIDNFKGIRSLELNLDEHPKGPIITLVGLNESGKTTILQALDYLQLGIDNSDPFNLLGFKRDDPHDLIPISQRSNFNDSIRISVDVELNEEDQKMLTTYLLGHSFHVTSLPQQLTIQDTYNFKDSIFTGRQARWTFFPKGTYGRGRTERSLYQQYRNIWGQTVDFLRKQMPSIWYFPNFLFDFPRRIYLDEQDDDSSKERFYRHLAKEVLTSVDGTATLQRHVSERISSDSESDKTALNQLLLQLGRKITQDVFESWNEIFQRPPSMKATFKAGVDQDGRRYLELSIEDTDGFYYIDERSLGFRWFFVFLLVTKYTRSGVDNSQNIMYLFDEPASNLHASAQSQLLKSLDPISEGSTIIYTTHSHHLINPEWLENTYVVRNNGFDFDSAITNYTANQTDVTIERYRSFASKHPDQTRYFQPILDVLDYQPSQLELVPDVVFVEGKNDFYTLSYVTAHVTGSKRIHLNLVPGNGAGSLDSVLRLYIGWARNFIVLLDSDKAGERGKNHYIKEFGTLLRDRVYTLGDLRPELSGKSLEDAFEQHDKDAVTHAVFPGQPYEKTYFNRAIQECLAMKKKVTVSSQTSKRLLEIAKQLSNLLHLTNS